MQQKMILLLVDDQESNRPTKKICEAVSEELLAVGKFVNEF
jgi:hypothetical protein